MFYIRNYVIVHMFETCLSVTCFFKIEALERKSFFGNVSYWVYSSTSSSTSSTSSIQSTVAPQVDLKVAFTRDTVASEQSIVYLVKWIWLTNDAGLRSKWLFFSSKGLIFYPTCRDYVIFNDYAKADIIFLSWHAIALLKKFLPAWCYCAIFGCSNN